MFDFMQKPITYFPKRRMCGREQKCANYFDVTPVRVSELSDNKQVTFYIIQFVRTAHCDRLFIPFTQNQNELQIILKPRDGA
jgi:hypothetical protein